MRWALVTGATRGIGYHLSNKLAEDNWGIVLISRSEKDLLKVSYNLNTDHNIETQTVVCDLSDTNAAEYITQVLEKHQVNPECIINNAGSYIKGVFTKTSVYEEHNLIIQQCLTQVKLIKSLLPYMVSNGRGWILNICSTGSFVPGPYNAVYCACKSFLLSFTEAIAEELKDSGISVTAFCPGGVDTEFYDNYPRKKSWFIPTLNPERAASKAYKAMLNNTNSVVIPGVMNKLSVFATRFLPRSLNTRLAKMTIDLSDL